MKTYWQAADANGKVYLYNTEKPKLNDVRGSYIVSYNYTADFLFPIPLKPLQIAEIKVNENGTWSYEIEREEGWYFAEWKKNSGSGCEGKTVINYSGGVWRWLNMMPVGHTDVAKLTISSTRIPDGCII